MFSKEKTIGILGGGQLGRMLALAAGRLGFNTICLDPAKDCPASQFTNHQIVAAYDDNDALLELASQCAVVTYEFENIPVASAQLIKSHSKIYPDSYALEISQDRLTEKNFILNSGMKTADFAPLPSLQELEQAIAITGLPAILKTRRMGYDGKGQIRLTKDNLRGKTEELTAILETECLLEAMVDFECEISVIGARTLNGDTACYDPARNTHSDGILVQSVVPCGLTNEIVNNAKKQCVALMDKLNYVGVIGVEFFVLKSGDLIINEFAPRVHNSGHWTEAACLISQFEQHIRAISGMPLGSTQAHSDCEMFNLIGEEIGQIEHLIEKNNCLVHDYGKAEIRDGRKMGHYTLISPKLIA